jgi:hypothetical protein
MEGETAAEVLSRIPWVRGWDAFEEATPWSTVGTGLYLARVDELKGGVETGDMDAEWQRWGELLSEEFVDYVQSEDFLYYECPRCKAVI